MKCSPASTPATTVGPSVERDDAPGQHISGATVRPWWRAGCRRRGCDAHRLDGAARQRGPELAPLSSSRHAWCRCRCGAHDRAVEEFSKPASWASGSCAGDSMMSCGVPSAITALRHDRADPILSRCECVAEWMRCARSISAGSSAIRERAHMVEGRQRFVEQQERRTVTSDARAPLTLAAGDTLGSATGDARWSESAIAVTRSRRSAGRGERARMRCCRPPRGAGTAPLLKHVADAPLLH